MSKKVKETDDRRNNRKKNTENKDLTSVILISEHSRLKRIINFFFQTLKDERKKKTCK